MAIDPKEKEAFGRRLRQALAAAGADERSPTRLAREFNRRSKGASVSINAAHHWLRGYSIPSQDKLKALAAWLGVTPEWLRFGETEAPAVQYSAREPVPTESDLELLRQFRRLSTGNRQIVRELLLTMLRVQQGK